MKKFVLKFIFAAIVLNALFYLYVERYKAEMFPKEFVFWDEQIKIIDQEKAFDTKINKLFIGDSRVAAGMTTRSIPNSYNLSLSGSSVVNSYYVLKRFLQNHKDQIDTVIMSFSPFLLIEGNDEQHFWKYGGKFKLHTYEEMKQIDSVCIALKDDTTFGDFRMSRYALYQMNWVYYYQANVRNRGESRKNLNQSFRENFIQEKGDVTYQMDLPKFDTLYLESTYDRFALSPVKEYYVKEIFKLCQAHNLHVIYTTMPLNKFNYHYSKKRFIEDFKGYLAHLHRSYPKYDIDLDLHVYSAELFGDYSHLSRDGALHFSDELKRRFFD